jgi:uncharacterized protein (DUF2141 family)
METTSWTGNAQRQRTGGREGLAPHYVPMDICVPVPSEGKYGIAVRHDLNGNGKTDITQDGGGFSNNPSISILNLGKPSVHKVAFAAGPGVTRITVNLKYM